ncbi:MAG: hypothetical protein HOM21_17225 [Halobacteriovoraceae bacterium]|nr:hypothetical protein [Halobacteriovoraceae bacterium]
MKKVLTFSALLLLAGNVYAGDDHYCVGIAKEFVNGDDDITIKEINKCYGKAKDGDVDLDYLKKGHFCDALVKTNRTKKAGAFSATEVSSCIGFFGKGPYIKKVEREGTEAEANITRTENERDDAADKEKKKLQGYIYKRFEDAEIQSSLGVRYPVMAKRQVYKYYSNGAYKGIADAEYITDKKDLCRLLKDKSGKKFEEAIGASYTKYFEDYDDVHFKGVTIDHDTFLLIFRSSDNMPVVFSFNPDENEILEDHAKYNTYESITCRRKKTKKEEIQTYTSQLEIIARAGTGKSSEEIRRILDGKREGKKTKREKRNTDVSEFLFKEE